MRASDRQGVADGMGRGSDPEHLTGR